MNRTLKTLKQDGRCFANVELSKYTTFRIGGKVKIFVLPQDFDQLLEIVSFCNENGINWFLLGNGSNILASDNGFDGIVICTKQMTHDFHVAGNKVTVGAGTLLSKLATAVAEKGLGGLEWAAGIPGTVGGAVFQNAGAFGGSMQDVVAKVLTVNQGTLKVFEKDELGWDYRKSVFQNKESLILDICFELKKDSPQEILSRMKSILEKRTSIQPKLPSAGSVFKKVDGLSAGMLIDQVGLKGFSIGGAKFSLEHANFIVNFDNAKAKDVLQLMQVAKEKVFEKYGVWLVQEIEFLGDGYENFW